VVVKEEEGRKGKEMEKERRDVKMLVD